MDNLLAKEVNRACSYGGRLTIALLDLDNIGQIGKQYGDGAADRILIHVANITKAVLRQNDYLVRYSGEEFLLALPDTEISGCRYMIDRLRQVFHKNPVVQGKARLDVTFCRHCATDRRRAGTSLILRADLRCDGRRPTASTRRKCRSDQPVGRLKQRADRAKGQPQRSFCR